MLLRYHSRQHHPQPYRHRPLAASAEASQTSPFSVHRPWPQVSRLSDPTVSNTERKRHVPFADSAFWSRKRTQHSTNHESSTQKPNHQSHEHRRLRNVRAITSLRIPWIRTLRRSVGVDRPDARGEQSPYISTYTYADTIYYVNGRWSSAAKTPILLTQLPHLPSFCSLFRQSNRDKFD